MDYPCGKLVIVVSAVLVQSCEQTHRHTQTDADEHFTPAPLVGVFVVNMLYAVECSDLTGTSRWRTGLDLWRFH